MNVLILIYTQVISQMKNKYSKIQNIHIYETIKKIINNQINQLNKIELKILNIQHLRFMNKK